MSEAVILLGTVLALAIVVVGLTAIFAAREVTMRWLMLVKSRVREADYTEMQKHLTESDAMSASFIQITNDRLEMLRAELGEVAQQTKALEDAAREMRLAKLGRRA